MKYGIGMPTQYGAGSDMQTGFEEQGAHVLQAHRIAVL